MGFYTYIVECADGTLYAGWTTDLDKRIRDHNLGKGARYTRSRLPVILKAHWEFDDKPQAMRYEWQLKRLSRTEKLLRIHEDLR